MPPRPRPLGLEPLFERVLPAVLTVLVPDGPAADLDPTLDLATAVGNRTEHPVDAAASVARYDAGTDALTAPTAQDGVVVLDWAGTPDTAAATDKAGAALAGYLRTLFPADGQLDLHFIGHGTGSAVVLAAVRDLAADDGKIGRLQVTSLNPLAPADAQTTQLAVPYNVDLADNYYITAGTPGQRLRVKGAGTEIDLTSALQAWAGRTGDRADHDEVRDWYLWTVDLSAGPRGAPYRDPALNQELAGFLGQQGGRAALFSQQLDLDKDGTNDDLGDGANIGFGQSIQTLFAPRDQNNTGLDLAFVIDTTGSMWDDIDAVKARATEILQNLREQAPDVRVGVVLYRDFPDGMHGDMSDYQTSVLIGFTADLDAVQAAIQGIQVGGGADTPESVYAGLHNAIDPSNELGGWRTGPIRRSVILMGDAAPHLIEPGTEYTKTSTLLRAARAGVDVATVATTADADAWWMFQSIAQLTGGKFYYTGPAPTPGGEWSDDSGWRGPIFLGGGGGISPGGGGAVIFGGGGDGGIYPYPVLPSGSGVSVGAVMADSSVGLSGGYAAAAADSVLAAIHGITAGIGTPGGGTIDPGSGPSSGSGHSGTTDPGSGDGGTGDGGSAGERADLPKLVFATPGPGGDGQVQIINAQTGAAVGHVAAFDTPVPGGVRVASADFNGDGVPDPVVGTGPGSTAAVRVLDGATGAELFSVRPFEDAFTGGVFVTAGDLTGDGVADLVISPDEGGGPRVLVYDGKTFTLVANFYGIDDANFRGGARVAVGDVNGDGTADLVVAAGAGGGPRLAVFNGSSVPGGAPVRLFNDLFVFEQTVRDGVFVTVGDLDGDGKAEVIVGGGPGGGPRVLALSGADLTAGRLDSPTAVADFFAGDPAERGGVRVLARDLDGDHRAELVVGDGAGADGRVVAYHGPDFSASAPPQMFSVDAFPGASGGVFVG
jgi:Mg-chelatase subunit ChlD